ncbi:thioredoxin domain-containing protein [Clostridium sp.]|jgi:thioredoxin 1|uniref:thioredoxin family protein n=1 Tax=Clostridium sp. TaxID=1506 RepID=UPI00258B5E10|nr:thioredoxin domain-containing protein [Clostridium sp.]MDF2504982.1 thioredoxin-like protein [Clostridium sp.]
MIQYIVKGIDNLHRLTLTKVEEKNFDSVTFDSNNVVLVFFGVKRCSVCREQIPILEQVAYEYKDKIKVIWVDIDKDKAVFLRFKLYGIPNILIFNNGEVKERIRGLNSKEVFVSIIEKFLNINL